MQAQHPLFSEMCAGAVPFVFSKNCTRGTAPLMKPSKMKRVSRTMSEQNPAPPRLTHSEWYGSLCLWNPGSTCFPALLCLRVAGEGCSLVCEACLFVCVCSVVGWLIGWLHTYAQSKAKVAKDTNHTQGSSKAASGFQAHFGPRVTVGASPAAQCHICVSCAV